MSEQLGFIGTGNITTAVVEGLCTADFPPATIVVSPRNAVKASKLSQRFSQVRIAASNQEVIDTCDTIFLATLPQIATSTLADLQFRPNQTIISLVAAISLGEMRKLVEPAQNVIRAIPLPPVAQHLGPILLYPENQEAISIFNKIGRPLAVATEKQFNLLTTVTALIGPFYALIDETTRWATAAGVDQQIAASYTAAMFHALSVLALDVPDGNFSTLVTEASSPGGLNEQALEVVRKHGGYDAFKEALDAIAVRMGEAPSSAQSGNR
jgi:pyrroline-5-carboxylate reductase